LGARASAGKSIAKEGKAAMAYLALASEGHLGSLAVQVALQNPGVAAVEEVLAFQISALR
jgi:hypothetical protein